MKLSGLVLLTLGLLLAGCGEEPPRPPVTPLAADESSLETLYQWGQGPWQVASVVELSMPHGKRDEELVYSVWYPRDTAQGRAERWPVLLFSHGNWSSNQHYNKVIEHWVSHGYVVLAPLHRDAGGGPLSGTVNLIRYGNLGLIQGRVDDLTTLLDALPAVELAVPELAGRLDTDKIAATGHSFGAFNAQQLGGAQAYDPDLDSYAGDPDPRIKAVVAISPPGPMFDEIIAGSWQQQQIPTLMTTGTWDTNAMFWPDWRDHLMSFNNAQPGDQYALVVQGADHYLGNLICRPELEQPPQHDALAMINNVTLAFLDGYLKQDLAALAYLGSSKLAQVTQEFAVLERR